LKKKTCFYLVSTFISKHAFLINLARSVNLVWNHLQSLDLLCITWLLYLRYALAVLQTYSRLSLSKTVNRGVIRSLFIWWKQKLVFRKPANKGPHTLEDNIRQDRAENKEQFGAWDQEHFQTFGDMIAWITSARDGVSIFMCLAT
jgi:hypothetical protein